MLYIIYCIQFQILYYSYLIDINLYGLIQTQTALNFEFNFLIRIKLDYRVKRSNKNMKGMGLVIQDYIKFCLSVSNNINNYCHSVLIKGIGNSDHMPDIMYIPYGK